MRTGHAFFFSKFTRLFFSLRVRTRPVEMSKRTFGEIVQAPFIFRVHLNPLDPSQLKDPCRKESVIVRVQNEVEFGLGSQPLIPRVSLQSIIVGVAPRSTE